MPGIGIRIDADHARGQIQQMIRALDDIRPLLRRIAQHEVTVIKNRFEERGPGWPKVNSYFDELKRLTVGEKGPLVFRGRLMGSITYQLRGSTSVRVGSALRYAATQQWGSSGPRIFNLHIEPIYEDGIRGKRIMRNEKGFILGKLRLEQGPNTKKQRMVMSITPRPFLKEPDAANWEEKAKFVARHIFGGDAT